MTPSGFSRLWSGPAEKPSREMLNARTRSLDMPSRLAHTEKKEGPSRGGPVHGAEHRVGTGDLRLGNATVSASSVAAPRARWATPAWKPHIVASSHQECYRCLCSSPGTPRKPQPTPESTE